MKKILGLFVCVFLLSAFGITTLEGKAESNEVKIEKSSIHDSSADASINIVPGYAPGGGGVVLPSPYESRSVSGTLTWWDDVGYVHPLQYTRVEIFDQLSGKLLSTVYTDEDGEYKFEYDEEGDYEIYIKVWAMGENSQIVNQEEVVYYYQSEAQVYGEDGIIIDWSVNMNLQLGQAFQISQAVIIAANYARIMNGNVKLKDVVVEYPHNDTGISETGEGCFYRPDQSKIYITGNGHPLLLLQPYSSWDVIMHEYGHHVENALGIEIVGGSHSFGENLIDWYGDKNKGIQLAWSESWASIFGIMAQQYFVEEGILSNNINTVGDTRYDSYNGAECDFESSNICKGEGTEDSVGAVLYDLYDISEDGVDSISLGYQKIWNYTANSQAKTFSEFVNYLYNNGFVDVFEFGKLLSYYGMAVSGLVQEQGTAYPAFSWIENGGSIPYPNNQFTLVVSSMLDEIILSIENIQSNTYEFTATDWNTILSAYGTMYKISVIAYQIPSHSAYSMTGGYQSSYIIIEEDRDAVMYGQMLTKETGFVKTSRQLSSTQCLEYYVYCETAGTKIVQTFANTATYIELCAEDGTFIDIDVGSGYGYNSLLEFEAEALRSYIVRVAAINRMAVTVNMIITSSKVEKEDETKSLTYEEIETLSIFAQSPIHQFTAERGLVGLIAYTPTLTKTFDITLLEGFDCTVYIIDTIDAQWDGIFDVDIITNSGTGNDTVEDKTFLAGRSYLFLYSASDLRMENSETGEETVDIRFQS